VTRIPLPDKRSFTFRRQAETLKMYPMVFAIVRSSPGQSGWSPSVSNLRTAKW
jgi:hypothetical protein